MYIPDTEWDLYISDLCDLLDGLERIKQGYEPLSEDGRFIKQVILCVRSLINVEDKPVPRKRSKKKRMLKKLK